MTDMPHSQLRKTACDPRYVEPQRQAWAATFPIRRKIGSLSETGSKRARSRWQIVGAGLCLALGGCGKPGPITAPPPSATQAAGSGQALDGNRARQMDFLNQIRRADPDFRTIDRAMLNEQNELGLILDHSVELQKIPALMRLMLTKMAAQFPSEDLTVLAYTPSSPPRIVGTARLNAGTRAMTYTSE